MTQLEAARQGNITPEMKFVARREDLDSEFIRGESKPNRRLWAAATALPEERR